MVDMDALNAKIAALKADYLLKMPEHLALYRTLSERLLSEVGQDVPDIIEEIRNYAHKLSGSAGSYGFMEIGEAAMKVDTSCTDILKDSDYADDVINDLSLLIFAVVKAIEDEIENAG